MVIYIKNMKHIKRIYEMTNNGNYTLRCLILGTELDGKYGMTVDGLEAIYHALYNGEDVYGAVEFAQYATQNINNEDFTMDVFDNLKTFIYDKIRGIKGIILVSQEQGSHILSCQQLGDDIQIRGIADCHIRTGIRSDPSCGKLGEHPSGAETCSGNITCDVVAEVSAACG